MFDKKYYELKQAKLAEKLQKLINTTFNAYINLSAEYFNQRSEIENEISELDQLIKNNMEEQVQATEAVEAPIEGAQETPSETEASE